MRIKGYILPVIVISQFLCTSLWFAGNAVMADLVDTFQLEEGALGHLTSMVQIGFITGTLVFALLSIADRYSPSRVFFACAVLGAIGNALTIHSGNSLGTLLFQRFLTGFFLAGIYPVGMKIAADYFDKGLGKSLGYLVGALVLGTAFPHLLRDLADSFPWKAVLLSTSSMAITGGVLMAVLVPDGPYRKPGRKIELAASYRVFRNPEFRSAAFGYFGHMWELYTFWAFTPIMFGTFNQLHPESSLNVAFWSFVTIGVGGPACVLGSRISDYLGLSSTAAYALLISGTCCLLSGLGLMIGISFIFILFMLIWGISVIADSPLFSTLVAQNAEPTIKGTALTIVTCVGFAITILSIQLVSHLSETTDSLYIYLVLAAGPVFGLTSLGWKKLKPRVISAGND